MSSESPSPSINELASSLSADLPEVCLPLMKAVMKLAAGQQEVYAQLSDELNSLAGMHQRMTQMEGLLEQLEKRLALPERVAPPAPAPDMRFQQPSYAPPAFQHTPAPAATATASTGHNSVMDTMRSLLTPAGRAAPGVTGSMHTNTGASIMRASAPTPAASATPAGATTYRVHEFHEFVLANRNNVYTLTQCISGMTQERFAQLQASSLGALLDVIPSLLAQPQTAGIHQAALVFLLEAQRRAPDFVATHQRGTFVGQVATILTSQLRTFEGYPAAPREDVLRLLDELRAAASQHVLSLGRKQ